MAIGGMRTHFPNQSPYSVANLLVYRQWKERTATVSDPEFQEAAAEAEADKQRPYHAASLAFIDAQRKQRGESDVDLSVQQLESMEHYSERAELRFDIAMNDLQNMADEMRNNA
jgi:hypothetical protein